MLDRLPEATGTLTSPDRGWAAKMIDYWRREGARESLGRAAQEAAAAVLSRRLVKVVALRFDESVQVVPPSIEAQFEEIGPDRLAEVDPIMYHPTRVLRERLRRGDRCFVATVGGRPCTYEWVALGRLHREVAGLTLRPDQCYVYNGRTLRALRGNRLHGFVLTAMCAQLAREGVREMLGRVDGGNQVGLHAIEKAGFRVAMVLRSWRILGTRYERVIWREDAPEE